jgi:hypothetical protein
MPYRYDVHRFFNSPEGYITPAKADRVPKLPRPLRNDYIERGFLTEHHYTEPRGATTTDEE